MRRCILALVLCALLALSPSAVAQSKKGKKGKSQRPPTSAIAPVSLVAHGNSRINVAGLHAFLDTVKLSNASDGLVVVNRLPLERYVLGLNEVPPEWPLHALRAQAVAARTYALWTLFRPPIGDAAVYGFDICATIECQVFSGADVLGLSDGYRWVQAVRDTAGEAILYRGEPILARYHSTSGGRTFDNEDVFYDDRPYPYLQGVPSPWEAAAPLWRWEVNFTKANLQILLERAGWWGPQYGRLVAARTLPPPSRNGLPYPDIKFRGTKGSLVRFGDDFRTIARDLAPGLFPGVYPSQGESGTLPETLPSERFKVVTTGNIVHFYGRGWGHGTGMSQWGAHGLALQGATYTDILDHYYRNTTVGDVSYKGPIDVGVGWGHSSVTASGSFSLVDGTGRTLVENALGSWTFTYTGGNQIAITPGEIGPARDPKPEKGGGQGISPIKVRVVDFPKRVFSGQAAQLTIDLSRAARVSTSTSGNSRFSDLSVELKKAGESWISWIAPLDPGRYTVRVEATSDAGSGRSPPIEIQVLERRSGGNQGGRGPTALEVFEETGASIPLTLTAFALLLVVGCWAATVTMGWWPRRRSSKSE